MRRLPVALVPAAVGLLLAACVADRDTTSPRSRRPTPRRLTDTPPACRLQSLLKSDARAFFTSNTDPASTTFTAMADCVWRGSEHAPDLATPFGLKIFAHIARAR